MIRSIMAASLSLLILEGCHTLVTSPAGPPSTTRVATDHKPTGSPLVQVIPNQTQNEWTISVTQAFEDTEEIHTVTPQKARRYLFWPLAPLNGLPQCQIGLLISIFSSHEGAATMREVGCMRLTAMEPLANTTEAHTVTTRQIETQQHTQPIAGADILFRDQETQDPIHAFTDTNGRATLRGMATRPLSGTLIVSVANQIVFRQDLRIAPRTHDRPQITGPLPTPLILQVRSSPTTGFNTGIEDRLRQSLLAHGFSVLPPNSAQEAILDEQRFQTTGRVEDSTQVRSGRLTRPTVMISVRRKDAGPYSIQLSFVRTGQQQELEVDSIEEIGKLLSGGK